MPWCGIEQRIYKFHFLFSEMIETHLEVGSPGKLTMCTSLSKDRGSCSGLVFRTAAAPPHRIIEFYTTSKGREGTENAA